MFTTHDWTFSLPGRLFPEGWVDVKMPGGFPPTQFNPNQPATNDTRRMYVVGTVTVPQADATSLFSNFSVQPAAGCPLIPFSNTDHQVAIVQCNGANSGQTNNISWQRFFYGSTPGLPQGATRPTNARAISVWANADPLEARIAICGETYHHLLITSQDPAGWSPNDFNNLNPSPTGFIAVFDGLGSLQWSHHFFAGNDANDDCAITDLSIRRNAEGEDIVTYCGIFTHGPVPNGTPLTPFRPFANPALCTGGATMQAQGQWDAFVGRLVRTGTTTQPMFHSIVGSPGQDGLFGLAEIDADRFVVVGSTTADEGTSTFPFTSRCGVAPLAGPYVLGTALVFDASLTAGGGNLVLESSEALGGVGAEIVTMARDVTIGRGAAGDIPVAIGSDMIYVVGSTNDPAFTFGGSGMQVAPTTGYGGNNDGFLAAMPIVQQGPTPPFGLLVPWTMEYRGTAEEDGFTGIGNWNEFQEHVTVVGWTADPAVPNGTNIEASSYFFNNVSPMGTPSSNVAIPNGQRSLIRIRSAQYGGPGGQADRPAALGAVNATLGAPAFQTFGVGQAAYGESGGGVAVGPDGRANVVGQAGPGGQFPFLGGGRPPDQNTDAIRAEFDLVPQSTVGPGVGRTDGTGFMAGSPFPITLPSPFTGGTTPLCALGEFGTRIGEPAPLLQRMLIDFEGTLAALPGNQTDTAILVDRPNPQAGTIQIGVLQINLPPAAPWAYLSGLTEVWLGGGTNVLFPVATAVDQSYRLPLAFAGGMGPFSAQMACLLATPIGSGACTFQWTASPAIWFSY